MGRLLSQDGAEGCDPASLQSGSTEFAVCRLTNGRGNRHIIRAMGVLFDGVALFFVLMITLLHRLPPFNTNTILRHDNSHPKALSRDTLCYREGADPLLSNGKLFLLKTSGLSH